TVALFEIVEKDDAEDGDLELFADSHFLTYLDCDQYHPSEISPDCLYYGKSYEELAADWLKWALGQRFDDEHPLVDPTGQAAANGQEGNVWFLGPVWGNDPEIIKGGVSLYEAKQRHITVPYGKALMFPVFPFFWFSLPGDPTDEEAILEELEGLVPLPLERVFCRIDGKKVKSFDERFDVQSPLFETEGTFIFDQNPGLLPSPDYSGSAMALGRWVLVKPLKPGKHKIQFRSVNRTLFNSEFEIRYRVVVEEPEDWKTEGM
ncbi:MAG: hypothetical protein AAF514_20065, partial [Verrucomicrobiota bacterium]